MSKLGKSCLNQRKKKSRECITKAYMKLSLIQIINVENLPPEDVPPVVHVPQFEDH